jgi:hypothetical protein
VQLRPHFYCSEFLENNSGKSDWQAAHMQGGKVGQALVAAEVVLF